MPPSALIRLNSRLNNSVLVPPEEYFAEVRNLIMSNYITFLVGFPP